VGARTRHAADGVFATAQLRYVRQLSQSSGAQHADVYEGDAGQAVFIYLRYMLDAAKEGRLSPQPFADPHLHDSVAFSCLAVPGAVR